MISDKTNELRLKNKTRVTFKTALNKRMPHILREAVRHAKQVHEVDQGEEQAEIATQVHMMITKPNTGVDLNKIVDKIELFDGHLLHQGRNGQRGSGGSRRRSSQLLPDTQAPPRT